MTGINIQYPWSDMLINGDKCVETRTYSLPEKYVGEELALIETPGKKGKFKARIVGTITFSHSFKYNNKEEWMEDHPRHLVELEDKSYGWNENKHKYGWVVCDINKFDEAQPAPKKKGIIFTHNCEIAVPTGV